MLLDMNRGLSRLCLSELAVPNGPKSQPVNQEQEDEGEGSEEEWEQVGPRNKTSVTRQADFVQTPITGIFGGHIRCVLHGNIWLGSWTSWSANLPCPWAAFKATLLSRAAAFCE